MITNEIQSVIRRTEEYVALWKQLAELARLQQKAVGHWQAMFGWPGFFAAHSQFAPASLSQNINPWNISLFQVISGTRGDPQTEVEIQFLQRSRDEIKFPSIDSLRAQIAKDVKQARRYFHLLSRFAR